MQRDKGASLELFEEPMTLDRAMEVVTRVPVGARLLMTYRRCKYPNCRACKGRGHGPYATAHWVDGGKPVQRYVGDAQKLAELREAWAMVTSALERAEEAAKRTETPEQRALRELRGRVVRGRHRRPVVHDDGAVPVPILGVRPK